MEDEESIRKWAMDEETLSILGQIEEISVPMLNYFYENVSHIFLFFLENANMAFY